MSKWDYKKTVTDIKVILAEYKCAKSGTFHGSLCFVVQIFINRWRCVSSLSIIGKLMKITRQYSRNVHFLCNHMSQPKYKINGDILQNLYWNSSHSSQTGCIRAAIAIGFFLYTASQVTHKKKSHGLGSGKLTGLRACLIYSNMML
ncbi:hypothetical protein AVEN_17584-1 [Araneus ventricosus]|uniref:Uncharacterized protein n=1 Tax=Araneus ventricosus TaxID=182803 RepID=A0A4Y2JXY8_ARAVE|nr:hypothetical protein AVEN_17584-1 [Araneus ventricosus]